MRILLSNDDGVYSPGIHEMKAALSRIGDVTVVAPQTEQSGVGLSITYLHPILIREHHHEGKFFGHAVAGSPADCVKVGVLKIFDEPPDLIVSGINTGVNVGIHTLYSGTVAAAIEGAFFGVTSIAVSQSVDVPPDYALSASRATQIIEQLMASQPKSGSLWSLNLPSQADGEPKGVKVCRMGATRHFDSLEARTDPRGRTYYWSGVKPIENHTPTPDSDVQLLSEGYATLVPLHFDLTEEATFEEYRDFSVDLG